MHRVFNRRRVLMFVYLVTVAITTSITAQACWQRDNNSGYFYFDNGCWLDGDCSGQMCRLDLCTNPYGWGQICVMSGIACHSTVPCSGTCWSETNACW